MGTHMEGTHNSIPQSNHSSGSSLPPQPGFKQQQSYENIFSNFKRNSSVEQRDRFVAPQQVLDRKASNKPPLPPGRANDVRQMDSIEYTPMMFNIESRDSYSQGLSSQKNFSRQESNLQGTNYIPPDQDPRLVGRLTSQSSNISGSGHQIPPAHYQRQQSGNINTTNFVSP